MSVVWGPSPFRTTKAEEEPAWADELRDMNEYGAESAEAKFIEEVIQSWVNKA